MGNLDHRVASRYDQRSFFYKPADQQENTLGDNHTSVCHCQRKVIFYRLDAYIITFLMHMRYDQEMYILSVASGLTHGVVIISIACFHKTPFYALSYIRSCLSCSIPYCLLESNTKRYHNVRYIVRNGIFNLLFTNGSIWTAFILNGS
ncbi:hypothetical protein Hanom_Chr03g00240621 [Helianthus anomalus]